MKQRFDIQKLLNNYMQETDFLTAISVEKEEEDQLLAFRKTIRESLKNGFRKLAQNAQIREGSPLYIANLRPKFWTQGSCSYGTLNEPAHTPPQQIDLDDGVYFPMQLVNGQPRVMKSLLLQSVWKILEDLAKENGWKLTKKTTCARIIINARMHIDIPVYAIPEDRYVVMTEALKANHSLNERTDSSTILLNPDEVYLALWDEGKDWIQSDPKELEKWFKKEIAIHGESLRRVCRYLKAWRDKKWECGGPSSIALMVAVSDIFDDYLQEVGEVFRSDCQSLLEVAKKLPIRFSKQVINPVGESELFPNGASYEQLIQIREEINCFSNTIISALCLSNNENEVVEEVTKSFGLRIPQKPDWVKYVTVSSLVRSVPAQTQKQPQPSVSHRSA